ncbi:hypothetical protein, partial [Peribacillus sp. Bi96]|uniref:hypothetical protein n=1 Tax=Peribacillus sp. Bi96 TaxID=2884273 RepID=UPI001E57647D
AACFLQIPRHRGHPCIKLTITTAFMVRDSHPIDCTHAGRTKKGRQMAASFSICIHIMALIEGYAKLNLPPSKTYTYYTNECS